MNINPNELPDDMLKDKYSKNEKYCVNVQLGFLITSGLSELRIIHLLKYIKEHSPSELTVYMNLSGNIGDITYKLSLMPELLKVCHSYYAFHNNLMFAMLNKESEVTIMPFMFDKHYHYSEYKYVMQRIKLHVASNWKYYTHDTNGRVRAAYHKIYPTQKNQVIDDTTHSLRVLASKQHCIEV